MNNMEQVKSEFEQMVEKQRALNQEFAEKGQALFKTYMKGFFEKNTGVKSIVWQQYTPYFNDGDECVFSVNTPTFSNTTDVENIRYEEYQGEEEGVWVISDIDSFKRNREESWHKETNELLKAAPGVINLDDLEFFGDMIQSTEMERVLRTMFGEHVEVSITAEQIQINDYDHD